MTETKKTVLLECISSEKKIIKIKFTKNIAPTRSVVYLVAAIKKCFKHNFYKIIVDMDRIEVPSKKFIATLVEATSKVRRKDGDIKLINLKEEARQSMATFNAFYYLSIQSEE